MEKKNERSLTGRYLPVLFAPAAVAVAMQLSWPFFEQSPGALFLLAIMFCSWYGGLGPGLLSVLVSSLLADYFFIAPYFHLWPVRHGDLVYLVTVAVVGPVLSVLSELMHRARRRAEISLEELTQQAARSRTDLIDRKHTEEALRRSREQMAGVIGSAMDAIITVDSEQRILLFNTAAEEMFCCSAGEAVGQALDRFIPERFRHAHSAQIRSFGETGVTARAMAGARTIYGLRTNGEEFPLEASISQLESNGQKLYTVILRDITERKRVEVALRTSEAQLQTIVEGLNDGLAVSDLEGQLLHFNRAALDMHGFASLDECRRHLTELADIFELAGMDGTVWSVDQWPLARILRGEKLRDLEVRIRRIHTDWKRVFSYGGTLVYDAGGQPLMAVVTICDITERNQAQEALLRLGAIVESSSDAIISTSLDGTIVIWNPGAETLFGYSAEEAIGRHMTMVVPADHADEVQRLLERIGRGESADNYETVRLNRDGKQIDVSITISPIRDAEGKIIGVSTSARDITERKLMESELQRTRDSALESARLKSEFLANMSHEIRTPMNGVIGMTELLLSTDLAANQRASAEAILASAESLLVIINDILDFSKIEADKLVFSSIDFSLRETLSEIMKTLAVRACAKGLELVYYAPPDVPEALVGDPGRLRQIIINLVRNAIKFTERGEVVLLVEKISCENDEAVLHFSVTDTGIGISPENQKLIFEPFVQADGSTVRQHGGTGLGLTISLRLIEKMRGSIWIESQLGQGSTFHFTARFKVQREVKPALAPPVLARLRDLSVLVVDDNKTNRRLLHDLLSQWHMKPHTVDGGLAALATLKLAKDRGEPFALVLLDADMPDLDGLGVAKQINLHPGLAQRVILMLRPDDSGNPCPEDLGITVCLTKPIRPSDLLNAIMAVFDWAPEQEGQSAAAAFSTSPSHRSPLRILLAEDNEINQKVAVGVLEQGGHSVTVTANGRFALSALEKERFDLILMDVQMPVMTGFEAVAAIREQEHATGAHIPIIAMTAHAMDGDRQRCLDAGMDGYLAKPVRARELLQSIENLMSGLAEAAPVVRDPLSNSALLDHAALLEFVGGNEELLRAVIGVFLKNCPDLVTNIRSAVAEGDCAALKLAAHTIRGSASTFLTAAAIQAATRLEQMGRESQLLSAEDELSTLEEEIARVELELNALVTGSSK